MIIHIIYSQLYDFDSEEFYIGGVETYIRNLVDVFGKNSIYSIVYVPYKRNCIVYFESFEIRGVAVGGKWMNEILNRVEDSADLSNDILIFGASIYVVNNKFVKSLAIQHGIGWDLELCNANIKSYAKTSSLGKFIHSIQSSSKHRYIRKMICVDLNYVNTMRSIIGSRFEYVYIPNFSTLDTGTNINLKSSNDSINIVFARRFEKIRGCDLLLSTIPNLLENNRNVHLTLAGDGSYKSTLHKVFDMNPQVTFLKYDANESLEIHRQHHIAIIPSIASEGTSLSLLEAMSAGCAVIATDIGGMSNVIINMHNGILIRPNVNELIKANEILINNHDLRKRLSVNAKCTVADSFSKATWELSWINVITELDNECMYID